MDRSERDRRPPPPEWLQRVVAALKRELPKDLCGQIEVNVFRGGVADVKLHQGWQASGFLPPPTEEG